MEASDIILFWIELIAVLLICFEGLMWIAWKGLLLRRSMSENACDERDVTRGFEV